MQLRKGLFCHCSYSALQYRKDFTYWNMDYSSLFFERYTLYFSYFSKFYLNVFIFFKTQLSIHHPSTILHWSSLIAAPTIICLFQRFTVVILLVCSSFFYRTRQETRADNLTSTEFRSLPCIFSIRTASFLI